MNEYFEVVSNDPLFDLLVESEEANKAFFKENESDENWERLDSAYNSVEEILYARYPDCFGWRAVASPFDENRFLVKIIKG